MGFFLNPKEGQQDWLFNNARRLSEGEAYRFRSWDTEALLCRVDTGTDFLLGIAYDDMERKAFAYPDGRAKQWYVVNRKIAERCYGSDRPWAAPYE